MKPFSQILKHSLLILLCFIAIFPLYWMVVSSFKNPGEIFGTSLIPQNPTFENYKYAFQQMPIFKMLINSVVISGVIAFAQLITSVLFAYAIIRWDFKGKKLVIGLITIAWLIPIQSIMVPNYVVINEMGLNSTLTGIIIIDLASSFACITMLQAFQSFPKTLIAAARLDGSSELQTLFKIILPNMKSSLSSLGILLFINAWNDYLWPMLIARKLENSPIQIGLKSFISDDVNLWGSLMAATTISCIPILILYLILQKNIIESFMKWGIK